MQVYSTRVKPYRNANYYRDRAEECRTIAELMADDRKTKMMNVAQDYERLATVAENCLDQR